MVSMGCAARSWARATSVCCSTFRCLLRFRRCSWCSARGRSRRFRFELLTHVDERRGCAPTIEIFAVRLKRRTVLRDDVVVARQVWRDACEQRRAVEIAAYAMRGFEQLFPAPRAELVVTCQ